jgi:hypothetical protein
LRTGHVKAPELPSLAVPWHAGLPQGFRAAWPALGSPVVAYGGEVTESSQGVPAVTLPGDLLDLHRAAAGLVAEAWAALAAARVVPCSDYRPFIRVGRDYEGVLLMGRPAMRGFTALLADRYPAWFQAPSGEFPRWDASAIAFSFVEACVTAMSLRGETGDAPGDAFDETVLELADYLTAADARLCCARRVSHLMTADRQELTIAGVTILAHQQFEEARQIRELIPTAASAFNGDPPLSFATPQATLVSYAEGPDPFALQADAGLRIDRLLLALRLLYGATAASVYQVTGETTAVCRHAARVDILPHDEHPAAVRPAVITPATAQPVERLLDLYDSTEHRARGEVVHGLEMAVIKFTDSFSPKPWFEKIVDLSTALEAALSGQDKADVTLRVCTRAACLLSTDSDPPPLIFADVKALYDMRSSLVHGSAIKESHLNGWLRKISLIPEDGPPRMRIERAVDRLRDLVRRSILMRLVLSSEGRWPLRAGNPPPLDQILTHAPGAQDWRDAWQQGTAALGEPRAAQRASLLCDSVFDDYLGKHS